MDQTHIGYTGWQEPRTNNMPAVTTIEVPEAAALGVQPAALQFDAFNRPRRHIDIFNRGRAPFAFTAAASAPWIVLSRSRGTVAKDDRLWVTLDWSKAPKGAAEGTVRIQGAGQEMTVKIASTNPTEVTRDSLRGFVEADGYVSIEAQHFTNKTDAGAARWERIDDYGRTLSAMTILPVTAASATPGEGTSSLEYRMYLFDPGTITVHTLIAPTLNFVPGRGLRFAVAFDGQPPQIVDALAHNSLQDWSESVKDNIRDIASTHSVSGSGYHVLRYWMVDPGIVLEKTIVDLGGLKPSYLGPPESYHKGTL